jgi:lipocalin
MNKTLTFHADPAHGWLEVTRADIEALNIAHKISRYSYQKDDRIFLEEDCDATHYLQAAKGKGWNITTTEKHSNADSFIRNLNSFKG